MLTFFGGGKDSITAKKLHEVICYHCTKDTFANTFCLEEESIQFNTLKRLLIKM